MSLDVYLKDPTATYEVEPLYWSNITHNLNTMAKEVGIYDALWKPRKIGIKYAKDIISILEKGLAQLIADPKYFAQFNSPNGWGTYKRFIIFVESYIKALKKYPEAKIKVSR